MDPDNTPTLDDGAFLGHAIVAWACHLDIEDSVQRASCATAAVSSELIVIKSQIHTFL
jgi:hypothetical protein